MIIQNFRFYWLTTELLWAIKSIYYGILNYIVSDFIKNVVNELNAGFDIHVVNSKQVITRNLLRVAQAEASLHLIYNLLTNVINELKSILNDCHGHSL